MSDGWMRAAGNRRHAEKLERVADISTPLKLSGANSPVRSTVSNDVAITAANAGSSDNPRSSSTRKRVRRGRRWR